MGFRLVVNEQILEVRWMGFKDELLDVSVNEHELLHVGDFVSYEDEQQRLIEARVVRKMGENITLWVPLQGNIDVDQRTALRIELDLFAVLSNQQMSCMIKIIDLSPMGIGFIYDAADYLQTNEQYALAISNDILQVSFTIRIENRSSDNRYGAEITAISRKDLAVLRHFCMSFRILQMKMLV